MTMFDEVVVAGAQANVMVYDELTRKWIPAHYAMVSVSAMWRSFTIIKPTPSELSEGPL